MADSKTFPNQQHTTTATNQQQHQHQQKQHSSTMPLAFPSSSKPTVLVNTRTARAVSSISDHHQRGAAATTAVSSGAATSVREQVRLRALEIHKHYQNTGLTHGNLPRKPDLPNKQQRNSRVDATSPPPNADTDAASSYKYGAKWLLKKTSSASLGVSSPPSRTDFSFTFPHKRSGSWADIKSRAPAKAKTPDGQTSICQQQNMAAVAVSSPSYGGGADVGNNSNGDSVKNQELRNEMLTYSRQATETALKCSEEYHSSSSTASPPLGQGKAGGEYKKVTATVVIGGGSGDSSSNRKPYLSKKSNSCDSMEALKIKPFYTEVNHHQLNTPNQHRNQHQNNHHQPHQPHQKPKSVHNSFKVVEPADASRMRSIEQLKHSGGGYQQHVGPHHHHHHNRQQQHNNHPHHYHNNYSRIIGDKLAGNNNNGGGGGGGGTTVTLLSHSMPQSPVTSKEVSVEMKFQKISGGGSGGMLLGDDRDAVGVSHSVPPSTKHIRKVCGVKARCFFFLSACGFGFGGFSLRTVKVVLNLHSSMPKLCRFEC